MYVRVKKRKLEDYACFFRFCTFLFLAIPSVDGTYFFVVEFYFWVRIEYTAVFVLLCQ